MTRETLADLLRAKIEASRAFSAAAQACRESGDLTLDQRVVLDLREKAALKAACAADREYDAALEAFVQVAA